MGKIVYAKSFLNAVEENKNTSPSDAIKELTKGTALGSAIGGGIELYIGYTRKSNLLLAGFLGALAGGLVSRIFIVK